MSFQNQGFWIAKGAGGVNDGEINYDGSSRIDLKRSHQWFMDGPESELFPNKKQAVAIPHTSSYTGLLNSTVSPWGNLSSFQPISGHFTERLFDSETARTENFDERNIPSVSSEKDNMGRKVEDCQFGIDSSFGLSMSHTLEDPRSCFNYGGIRKVKVSQVKDSEPMMPLSMEHAYNRVHNNNISTAHVFNKTVENAISMGLAYSKADVGITAVGETYDGENNIFISMGQPYSKGDDNISVSQTYKEHGNITAISHTFSKDNENSVSMSQSYNKADENGMSMGHIYHKGDDGAISLCQSDNNDLSIGQSYGKGESTMISFGGYDDDDANPSGRLISTYDMLMSQSSFKRSEVINEKELDKSDADVLVPIAHTPSSGAENASRKKDYLKASKKASANSFPSNVRSLLSTGMLDGVRVKYVAWSREKELPGIIKGSGYLCGCQTCNFSKVINAYEFERHANCKTKHPNNHIYFDNGKTIYGVVQELRSTPQNMLFDVIQTITGSTINQKSFRLWKESFLAATRELQRIYGQDDGKPL